jgi:hypothetical protein
MGEGKGRKENGLHDNVGSEFEEPKPGATGRPAAKPGTFIIVVVARR